MCTEEEQLRDGGSESFLQSVESLTELELQRESLIGVQECKTYRRAGRATHSHLTESLKFG